MNKDLDFPEPYIVRQRIETSLPLYTFDLSKEIDIDQIIANIKKLKIKYPSSTQTNVITENGWRSPYIFSYQPEIESFVDIVLFIKKQLKKINSFDIKLINLWTVIYGNGDLANSHNHFTLWDNLAYNTVLYLTDSQSPIIFDTIDSKFEIYPKKGMLLVMHPLTMHSVVKVQDQSERIVLVCNFGI